MKKRFLTIAIILLLALAACGRNTQELVDQAGDAATRLAEEAADVAATAAAVATDIADGPDSDGGDPELTPEPTDEPIEGPTGETVTVDPTQPIAVEDSNGTQVSVGGNELVDENGNPPAGDVQVNMFTPDSADEEAEAEASAACEGPDTNEVLTVWSYNDQTGLWEEEGLVAYNPATGQYDLPVEEAAQDETCDASVASVSVEVTDDAGNEYDLADGAEAEVSVPCEPKPDEVLTVWTYNVETGLWEEEGPATVEGETCSAEVSNLSNVNFVAQDPVSGMQGQVVDLGSGEPLTGAQVCIQGSDQCATVDDNGNYSLSDLDPAEFVFEVSATDYITATQTLSLAAGETLTQDFALTATNPVLAVLPDEVVLRGVVVAIGTTTNLLDEATIAIGDTFQFLESSLSIDLPDYNISAGVPILIADVLDRGGNGYSELVVAIPNRSKSEIGQQANAAIENLILTIKTAGEANELVKTDDLMEVVLSDPTSTALPYTINFYRGEARELVATFTIDTQ